MSVVEHATLVVPHAIVSPQSPLGTMIIVPAMLSSILRATSPSALSYLLTVSSLFIHSTMLMFLFLYNVRPEFVLSFGVTVTIIPVLMLD